MKRIILFVFGCLFFDLAFSQIILDDEMNTYQTHNIAAPEYIQMKPGFRYQPYYNTSNYLRAYIDPSIFWVLPEDYVENPVDPETREINTDLAVGSTPGQASVSLTGAATYSIPIYAPPGINNMVPNLSLVYSSQGGPGIAGYGWDLAGISKISRAPNTIYHDGNVKPVNFEDDKFVLDGQRLICIDGNYGAEDSKYYTEVFNGSIIIAHGQDNNSPLWFEVRTNGGLTIRYGYNIDSRFNSQLGSPNCWYIDRITDANGNYMKFNYYKTPIECYIKSVEYTFNDQIDPNNLKVNTVNFWYKERRDKTTSFTAGSRIEQNVLLDHIDILADNKVIKSYHLKHYFNVSSKLNEIIEMDDNNNRYNSTVFGYNDSQSSITMTDLLIDDEYPPLLHRSDVTGDVNGDGLTDIIALYMDPLYNYIYFKVNISNNENENLQFINTYKFVDFKENTHLAKPCDLNNDGKIDFICEYRDYPNIIYYAILSNGNTYSLSPEFGLIHGNDGSRTTYLGDFNGDLQIDILSDDGGNLTCYTFNRVTSSFEALGCTYLPSNGGLHLYDFSGDAKTDILFFRAADNICEILEITDISESFTFRKIYEGGFPYPTNTMRFGDFNGDGLCDIFILDSDNTQSYVFTGNTFIEWNTPQLLTNLSLNDLKIIDVNSDGIDDYVQIWIWQTGTANRTLYVDIHLSTTDESNPFTFYQLDYDIGMLNALYYLYYDELYPSDFDGDSKTDICIHRGATWALKILRFKNNNELTTVANGLNQVNKFDYKRLTPIYGSNNIYTPSQHNIDDIIDLNPSMLVVSKLSQIDHNKELSISYKYKGLSVHRFGKGLLGFSGITRIDQLGNLITENYSVDENYFVTNMASSIQQTPNNMITSRTDLETDVLPIVLGKKSVMVQTKQVITSNYIDQVVEKNNYFFNSMNSLYRHDFQVSDLYFKTTVYSDFTNEGSWYNSRPRIISTDEVRTGKPHVENSLKIEFDNIGNIRKKIVNYDKPITLTYNYEYSPVGSVKKILVQAPGMPDFQTQIEYENNFKFVKNITDNTGLISYYEFESSFGNLLKSINGNGYQVDMLYDGFGRMRRQYFEDGTINNTLFKWPVNQNDGYIYSIASVSNTNPQREVFYDKFGRQILAEYKDMNGNLIKQKTVYDDFGRLYRISNPYSISAVDFTTYLYDEYNRLDKIILPNTTAIEYAYNNLTTTTTKTGTNEENIFIHDPLGNVISVTDAGGTITYDYYSDNLLKEVKLNTPDEYKINYNYDQFRRLSDKTEKSLGTVYYTYDNFGNIKTIKDGNQNITEYNYDQFGRLLNTTGAEITKYEYYPVEGSQLSDKGKLKKILDNNGIISQISYDNLSRIINRTITIENQDYSFNFEYDDLGRIETYQYPSGYKIKYQYNEENWLSSIIDYSNNMNIYTPKSVNNFGQITEYENGTGVNKIVATRGYNGFGQPTFLKAGKLGLNNLQNLEYNFNIYNGLLTKKTDKNIMIGTDYLQEEFKYESDLKLPLTQTKVIQQQPVNVSYLQNGNIDIKSDVGVYNYYANNKYILETVTNPNPVPDEGNQIINYTSSGMVSEIINNNLHQNIEFTYGPGNTLIKSVEYSNDELIKKKLIISNDYEIEIDNNGNSRELHYLPGNALVIKTGQQFSMYYILKDYLGSVYSIADANGNIVTYNGNPQIFNFDAWGRRRNPTDWSTQNINRNFLIDKGYCGHSHLDNYGLINMGARLYDPYLGRMVSPDKYVGYPTYTQSYNRYTYAINNPLVFTDPDGNNPLVFSLIGGFNNVYNNRARIDYWWEALAYYGVGVTSTFVGSYAGQGTAGLVEEYGTLAAGTLGGGVGSGVSGGMLTFGNSLLYGKSLKSSFYDGLQAAKSGAISGAATGLGLALLGGVTDPTSLITSPPNYQNVGRSTLNHAQVSEIANTITALNTASNMIGNGYGRKSQPNSTMDVLDVPISRIMNIEISPLGPGISNTGEAFNHYFNGDGSSVLLDQSTVIELLKTPAFDFKNFKIVNGLTSSLKGNFPINMTSRVLHVGRTNVNYLIECNDEICTVSYDLFVNDGFYDVDFIHEKHGDFLPWYKADGLGPNLELLGGHPYLYKTVKVKITFINPGYK